MADPEELEAMLITAIAEGNDKTAALLVGQLPANPLHIELIAEANLPLAFGAYLDRHGLEEDHRWGVGLIASIHRNWAVLEEMIARGMSDQVRLPLGKVPAEVIRAALATGSSAWETRLFVSSLLAQEWEDAVFLLENMSLAIADRRDLITRLFEGVPAWFLERVLDLVPMSSDAAMNVLDYRQADEQAVYLEMLKQRGYDLDSYFAAADRPLAVLHLLYNPDYAETALLHSLDAEDEEAVSYLQSRGAAWVDPDQF